MQDPPYIRRLCRTTEEGILACIIASPVVNNLRSRPLVQRRWWSYNFLVTYVMPFLPLTNVTGNYFSRSSSSAISEVLYVCIIVGVRSELRVRARVRVTLALPLFCYLLRVDCIGDPTVARAQ